MVYSPTKGQSISFVAEIVQTSLQGYQDPSGLKRSAQRLQYWDHETTDDIYDHQDCAWQTELCVCVCVYVCVLTEISTIAISQMSWEFGTNRMKVERLLVLCFEDEVKVSSWQCESMDRNDKNYWHKQNNKTAPSNRERVFDR